MNNEPLAHQHIHIHTHIQTATPKTKNEKRNTHCSLFARTQRNENSGERRMLSQYQDMKILKTKNRKIAIGAVQLLRRSVYSRNTRLQHLRPYLLWLVRHARPTLG
jgi:hypothetical protein